MASAATGEPSGDSSGTVREIFSEDEFRAATGEAGGKLVVVDFYATWCGPCRAIAPAVALLAAQHRNVVFLKVDVDTNATIAATFSVTAMPTFVLLKARAEVARFSGADHVRLADLVARHGTEGGAGGSDGAGGDGAGDGGGLDFEMPVGQGSLAEYIDRAQVQCLNQSSAHTAASVLQRSEHFLESDCDEQLLLTIPFNQPVRLHSVKIDAPADGHAPRTVQLFVNQPSLDFDSLTAQKPVQELQLKHEQLAALVPLAYVKLQSCNSITFFVSANHGADTTIINRIVLVGSPKENTKMSDFKRVAGKAGEAHG